MEQGIREGRYCSRREPHSTLDLPALKSLMLPSVLRDPCNAM